MLGGHVSRLLSHPPTRKLQEPPVATAQCPTLCRALYLPLNPLFCKEPPPRHVSSQLRKPFSLLGLDSITTRRRKRRGNMATELTTSAPDDVPEAMAIEGKPLLLEEPSVSGSLHPTLNRLSKWIMASFFAFVIIWRHDAEVLWAAMGSILNVCLSTTLKRIINHQRPVPNVKSGPGMPSSHAQSIFYASAFLIFFRFNLLRKESTTRPPVLKADSDATVETGTPSTSRAIFPMVHWSGINAVTFVTGIFALATSTYLSWLRVSQQFHTPSQVLVGAIVGSLFAATWFWSWHTLVLEAFSHSILVRLIVVLGSLLSCVGFLFHVILHWFKDERRDLL